MSIEFDRNTGRVKTYFIITDKESNIEINCSDKKCEYFLGYAYKKDLKIKPGKPMFICPKCETKFDVVLMEDYKG